MWFWAETFYLGGQSALNGRRPPTQAAKQPEQREHNNKPAVHERLKKIRIKKNTALKAKLRMLMVAGGVSNLKNCKSSGIKP